MDLKAKQKKEGEEMEALKHNLEQNAKKGSRCMKFEMHVLEVFLLVCLAMYIGLYYGYDLLDHVFSYKPHLRVT